MEYIYNDHLGNLVNSTPNGVYDWVWAFMIASISIYAFDRIICERILKLPIGTGGGARWFAVHAFCNIWISWTALPDLLLVLFDPVEAISSGQLSSVYPLAVNEALHIYHSIAYFEYLTHIDWLHHIIMSFITIPLLLLQNATPTINANHVFITGIPGAIDYTLLVLVKMEIIENAVEKSLNRIINVWIRAPGIFYVTVIAYVSGCLNQSDGDISTFQFRSMIVIMLINYWNAFYFMEKVVGSHYKQKAYDTYVHEKKQQ